MESRRQSNGQSSSVNLMLIDSGSRKYCFDHKVANNERNCQKQLTKSLLLVIFMLFASTMASTESSSLQKQPQLQQQQQQNDLKSMTSVDKRSNHQSRMQYNFGFGKRNNDLNQLSNSDLSDVIEIIPATTKTSLINNNELEKYYYLYDPDSRTLISLDDDFNYNVVDPSLMSSLSSSSSMDNAVNKRSKPQRFSFGLGKRSKEVTMDDENGNLNDNLDYNYDENDHLIKDKRTIQPYGFGLGKRHPYWTNDMILDYKTKPNHKQQIFVNNKIKKMTNYEDFIKRRYSFGLGKRSV